MLQKLMNFIHRYNTKRIFRILLVISAFCYILMGTKVFGLLSDFNSEYMLDLLLYYSGDKFVSALESISAAQIGYYRILHSIDYLFIVTFYPLLVLILDRFIEGKNKFKYLMLLPVLAMLCDLFENLIIDFHLSIGVGSFLSTMSGILTTLKFTSIFITIIIAIVFITKSIKRRRSNG